MPLATSVSAAAACSLAGLGPTVLGGGAKGLGGAKPGGVEEQ